MHNDLQKPTALLVFVSFLTVFFAAVFAASAYLLETPPPKKEIATVQATIPAVIEREKSAPDPFQGIFLEAKAAYVLDARTGKTLFALNEESQLPLASLTKVMTALVASRSPQGTAVSFAGGEWNLKDLLEYTLVVSSNEGASAIAGAGGALLNTRQAGEQGDNEDAFVQKMNEEARELGLSQTFFLNPSGLDVDGSTSGAYGSAKDMALLFAYIVEHRPDLMEATTYDSLRFSSLSGASRLAENTNVLAGTIPGLLASKTGYTELAGGNLAVAFNIGPMRPVVVAVLGSSQEGRFLDVDQLINASIRKIGQGGQIYESSVLNQ